MKPYMTGGTSAPPNTPNMAYGAGKLKPLREGSAKPARARKKPGGKKRKQNPTGGTPPVSLPPEIDPYMDEVNAATKLRYGREQGALNEQIAQSGVNQGNITNWFADYKNDLEKSRIAQAAYMSGQQTAAQQIALAQGAPTQFQGQTSTEQQTDSANAANVRTAIQEGFAEALRQSGLAYNASKEDQKGVAGAAQLTARLAEDRNLGSLVKQNQALQAEKGAYRVDTRRQLKSQAHTERLEDKAFDVDVAEKSANIKTDRIKIRQDAREARQDRKAKGNEVITSGPFAGYTKREVRKLTPAEKTKLRQADKTDTSSEKSKFTPTQQTNARKEFRSAYQLVKTGGSVQTASGSVVPPSSPDYPKEAYAALIRKGVDPVLARAAIQMYRHGKVKPNVANALYRDYGIKVQPRKATKPPKPYSPPTDYPGSDAAQG